MPLRPIVRFPDPRLREPTVNVEQVDDGVRALVADMIETMYAAGGAGLAAIQVGSPLRIFVIEEAVAGKEKNQPPVVFINPVIEWLSDETESNEEGCLSFPGIYVPVKRSLRARTRALDADGKEFVIEGEGLFARAMQHEHDHLVNRLLIDHVGPIKRRLIQRRLEREAREEAEAEGEE